MMTNVGMFDEAKIEKKVKRLKAENRKLKDKIKIVELVNKKLSTTAVDQFQKFHRQYQVKMKEVLKENKFKNIFDHVDEALRRVRNNV